MRTSPALALVAAFLASAVSALSLPQAGLEQAPAQLHRRAACHAAEHHKKRHHNHHDNDDAPPQLAVAPAGDYGSAPQPVARSAGDDAPAPQPEVSPAGGDASAAQPEVPQPVTPEAGADDDQPKKMHKKKSKGKCAVKNKGQGAGANPSQAGGNQNGDLPPVTGVPGSQQGNDGSQDAPVDASNGGLPSGNNGADQASKPEDYSNGQQPGVNPGDASAEGDKGAGSQPTPTQPEQGAPGDEGIPPGGVSGKSWGAEGPEGDSAGKQPGAGQAGSGDGSSDQDKQADSQGQGADQDQNQDADNTQPEGYGSASGSKFKSAQGEGVLCKGMKGSTTLPRNGKVKPDWFNPELIHHGPGTQFGGPGLWDGGACMYDGMPHHSLPSVAMDQSFFQDGLACGTCVEIASTDASLFSNSAHWSVETPKKGTLPAGKKTVAIVSDLCPGVDQCFSGLDMHLDAWNSVTNNAAGTKLPINWKFVNCKEAFEKNNSGIKNMQVHWRSGASPGFFEVQIRGNHEAVVRVEMKWGHKGWSEATLKDSTWWQWVMPYDDQQKFDQKTTAVSFRITDWQGETITSDKGTTMGTDLFFQTNFDRVADLDQA
ncbi:uncharacterized protein SPSC_03679 [Sporisorium scitamineum]|uniref:Expansin-like EG45 domain-containing protein n=1 Tax=Sporisorium scitamineum TaxID=49012 RepID=A0A0F7RY07_9BASI|nr:uncharacterized protein SPSC_03679 [Sporisorium scitamineum]CDR99964.1 hypothetical protein [Sporisorium scitamineum]